MCEIDPKLFAKARLNQYQEKSLLDFARKEGLTQSQVNALANLSGRGYRPPITAEKWAGVWNMIAKFYQEED